MPRAKVGNTAAKLTPELQERFVAVLRAGNYVEVACRIVGIHKSTYYDWLKIAHDEASEPFVSFALATEKAIAESEARDVALIAKAAADPKIWVAAAWRLERRFPERWGRRDKHELTGADGGPIAVKAGIVMLPPEDDRTG
ncbi:hypothetical protein LZC95_50110 [Pendulispora brunnea]|uniref:Transposase n=1 Tax=Pendulispora brunnea TaxID=2905690 RepID=A0ABZ2K794_9BACT